MDKITAFEAEALRSSRSRSAKYGDDGEKESRYPVEIELRCRDTFVTPVP